MGVKRAPPRWRCAPPPSPRLKRYGKYALAAYLTYEIFALLGFLYLLKISA